MNKQLVQDIIKAGNKAIKVSSIKYTIYTKHDYYYVYDEVCYNDIYIHFIDDYDNDIILFYNKITGIKLSNI